ncbi:MAG: dimethylallyladenosine tRNA methylthiotransferase [Peptococcaceae bacterium BRH_c4b]|nr:MAG: dimethylallyladenosine tRNA methylthiotransferase [Peptococcaceae bacterium BRH_c4b]
MSTLKQKKYLIITFGCQMNEHDAEVMAGTLEQLGYINTDDREEADIILINTCCVRETAENKVYGLLGRLRKLKEKNHELIIAIGGCMTQQEETALKIKQRFSHVDLIFGTHSLHELPDLIRKIEAKRSRLLIHKREHQGVFENLPIKRGPGIKAWVPVTYGCNNFCTYCIVPYVRGRERSRKPVDICSDIDKLARAGFQEVTLLGQNVNSYGKDLGNTDFADLLSRVNAIDGITRIRFMTSHPRDFTGSLIKAVTGLDKVCEHIHLPVQAGSDTILKAMNRGYSREYYFELVQTIRSHIPGVSLTTDIMAGFPGETEADFEETLELLEKIRFDGAFTFVYNVREGTPAAKMPGQVPEEVKSSRIKRLVDLQNAISLQLNQSEVGRLHEVLVDGSNKTNANLLSGRTRTNKLVKFSAAGKSPGDTVRVLIKSSALTYLEGEIVSE